MAVCIVGGDDDDIARTIFERKSAGCGTVGDTQVTFIDTEHFNASYVYNIVRPTAVDFTVKVMFFSGDMDATTQANVKAAIISDFLGELKNARVKLATTVYASRFYKCIQDVTDAPIKEIVIGIAGGPQSSSVDVPANKSPTLSAKSITLAFGG